MSTRAVYTFKDSYSTHHVYVHHDGYPSGAAANFTATLESGMLWALPRFESCEFSAAFAASVKNAPGGVRLANSRYAAADVAYGYTITMEKGILTVACHATDFWDDKPKEKKLYKGSMAKFIETADTL